MGGLIRRLGWTAGLNCTVGLAWLAIAGWGGVVARGAETDAGRALGTAAEARGLVQQLVARRLTACETADEFARRLDFDRIWPQLSAAELLTLLCAERWIVGYDQPQKVLSVLDERLPGIAWRRLRADGLLTALALSADGPLLAGGRLAGQPAWRRSQMAKVWLRERMQQEPWQFWSAFSAARLLELADDRIPSSAATPQDIHAYAWYTSGETQPANLTFAAGNVLFYRQGGRQAPDPGAAVEATQRHPAGHRVLRAGGIEYQWWREIRGVAVGGYCDYGSEQTPLEFNLLWMDEWEAAIRSRMDAFFARYKELGGELDVFLLDIEGVPQAHGPLRSQRSRFGRPPFEHLKPSGQSVWQAVQADARWPAVRKELLRFGLKEADLSVWESWREEAADWRTGTWNAVMERRWLGALQRALYEPLARHFPQVRVHNFRSHGRNQTVPIISPRGVRPEQTWFGIGGWVGTHQGGVLHDTLPRVVTPGGVEETTPPTDVRVAAIARAGDEVRIRLAADVARGPAGLDRGGPFVLTKVFSDAGACPGGQVRGRMRGAASRQVGWIDVGGYLGVHEVLDRPGLGLRELTFRLPAAPGATYPDAELADVTCSLRLSLRDSYRELLGIMQVLRSMTSTADEPLCPCLAGPSYFQWLAEPVGPTGRGNEPVGLATGSSAAGAVAAPAASVRYAPTHLPEMVFHAVLSGADEFVYWNPDRYWGRVPFPPYWQETGAAARANDNRFLGEVLAEAQRMVGFSGRRVLTHARVPLDAPYVLSGAEAAGRRVWRLTPDPRQPVEVRTVGDGVEVRIGSERVTFAHATADPRPGYSRYGSFKAPVPCGYWIVQTATDSLLTRPAAEVAAQLGLPAAP